MCTPHITDYNYFFRHKLKLLSHNESTMPRMYNINIECLYGMYAVFTLFYYSNFHYKFCFVFQVLEEYFGISENKVSCGCVVKELIC